MKRRLSIGACVLTVPFTLWLAFVNHIEAYEVGLAWNFASGELIIQDDGGYYFTSPWTLVARIDTRPQRVCITSASEAAFNCKLAQFVPEYWEEFIAAEGWRYYWLDNRISFNFGHKEEYRGFRNILRGYAYSASQYPFVTVLRDFEN